MISLPAAAIVIGVFATALIDFWGWLMSRFAGIPMTRWGMAGRWLIGIMRGRWRLDGTDPRAPTGFERALGWAFHYSVGIAYGAALLWLAGPDYLRAPSFLPALAVGLVTVTAGWFIMMPGMGAGVFASRTPSPWAVRLRSIVTHVIFGIGLFLPALLIARFAAAPG